MRILIACRRCGRQYEAAEKRIGKRFRCYCGETLTVQEPKGHDASVVNCSSCGAPREQGSANCKFCEADFTLHERDLHTVCPQCMARISDRAKFCHHCGTQVIPESVAGEETQVTCPACGEDRHLRGRRVAEVPVLECDRCAGLWLGTNVFKQVTERAATQVVDTGEDSAPRQANAGNPAFQNEQSARYRKCPMCNQIMYRRNYARRSGVIIDVCKEHGIWFDADELSRIITWIRDGGLAKTNRDIAKETAQRERAEKRTTERSKQYQWANVEPQRSAAGFGLAAVLTEAMFWFFEP